MTVVDERQFSASQFASTARKRVPAQSNCVMGVQHRCHDMGPVSDFAGSGVLGDYALLTRQNPHIKDMETGAAA